MCMIGGEICYKVLLVETLVIFLVSNGLSVIKAELVARGVLGGGGGGHFYRTREKQWGRSPIKIRWETAQTRAILPTDSGN